MQLCDWPGRDVKVGHHVRSERRVGRKPICVCTSLSDSKPSFTHRIALLAPGGVCSRPRAALRLDRASPPRALPLRASGRRRQFPAPVERRPSPYPHLPPTSPPAPRARPHLSSAAIPSALAFDDGPNQRRHCLTRPPPLCVLRPWGPHRRSISPIAWHRRPVSPHHTTPCSSPPPSLSTVRWRQSLPICSAPGICRLVALEPAARLGALHRAAHRPRTPCSTPFAGR